jgi:hypothetical protein
MLEPAARLGYASKAVIYGIIGVLAVLTAVNRGGFITDTSGALRLVLTRPFGRALLLVLAVGLCGYAVWRLLDAVMDPDRDGTSPTGALNRIGHAVRGCVYGGLGLEAFRMVRGRRGSNGDLIELWTARVLDWPLGELVVAVAGAALASYGAMELVRVLRGQDDPKVDWSAISRDTRSVLRKVSRFGVGIRAGLLMTLGAFLVRAALTHDPDQAAGPRESLLRLGGLFEGRWFLAVVAAGLVAYAIDQAVHAYCRRIRRVI